MQPDVYTREIGMTAPLHVSSTWNSISELFVTVSTPFPFPQLGFDVHIPSTDRRSSAGPQHGVSQARAGA